jgi:hypothetical protein
VKYHAFHIALLILFIASLVKVTSNELGFDGRRIQQPNAGRAVVFVLPLGYFPPSHHLVTVEGYRSGTICASGSGAE